MFTPAIQLMETVENEPAAIVMFAAINILDGVVASRVIKPTPQKPEWRVQAIFENSGQYCEVLPDGMMHVMWRGYF